jgi:hypothetical protein
MTKGEVQVICLSRELEAPDEYGAIKKMIEGLPSETGVEGLVSFASERFEGEVFSLGDFFAEDRDLILSGVTERKTGHLEPAIRNIYHENREFLRLLSEASLKPPDIILVPARTHLERELAAETAGWKRSLLLDDAEGIARVVSEAEYYGVEIDKGGLSEAFSRLLLDRVKELGEGPAAEESAAVAFFMDYCEKLGVEIDTQPLQNEIFRVLEGILARKRGKKPGAGFEKAAAGEIEGLLRLAERLNFNIDRWKELLQ